MIQTTSVREYALRAIETALAGPGSPANQVSRSQLDQIDQASLPCYDFSPGDGKTEDPGEFGDHNSVTQTLSVQVRGVVKAGEEGDSALDPFYIFAVQQLAGAPANLGGAVNLVEETGNATIFKPNGANLIGLEMHFDLKFATKRGDPTQRG